MNVGTWDNTKMKLLHLRTRSDVHLITEKRHNTFLLMCKDKFGTITIATKTMIWQNPNQECIPITHGACKDKHTRLRCLTTKHVSANYTRETHTVVSTDVDKPEFRKRDRSTCADLHRKTESRDSGKETAANALIWRASSHHSRGLMRMALS